MDTGMEFGGIEFENASEIDTSFDTDVEGFTAGVFEVTDTSQDITDSDVSFQPLEADDVVAIADTNENLNVSEWIDEINPNYDPFDINSEYSKNCGSCAYAVYNRLEGDMTACAGKDNVGIKSEMEALTGMEQVSMTPQEIEEKLLSEGEGAHAIIGIDRAKGPGHWFNAACIDGKVVAIDGQVGEIKDWPPDYGDVVNWDMSIKNEG